MEDEETVDGSAGFGGPCGACEYRRRDCGPNCIFVPFFPPGSSTANFARVRALFGEDALTNVINLAGPFPELREMFVRFMITDAHARADGTVTLTSSDNYRTSLLSQIDIFLNALSHLTTIAARVLDNSRLIRSPEIAAPTVTRILQDVQEAVGGGGDIGDARGGGDREDRGDEAVAPAAALNDDIGGDSGKVAPAA